MFGDHEARARLAISTVWPLVSYLNSMVSFYRYLFRRLWTIAVFALRDHRADCFHLAVKPCTLPLDLPLGQRTGSLLVFFPQCGILHCHLLPAQR